jgi:hypothetical protein
MPGGLRDERRKRLFLKSFNLYNLNNLLPTAGKKIAFLNWYRMKKIFLTAFCTWMLLGCSVLKKKETYGCPTNGKNVGAEKILSGDKEATKAARKAGKFKS